MPCEEPAHDIGEAPVWRWNLLPLIRRSVRKKGRGCEKEGSRKPRLHGGRRLSRNIPYREELADLRRCDKQADIPRGIGVALKAGRTGNERHLGIFA